MKLKRKTGLIGGLALTAIFIITMFTACTPDEIALQGNPVLATSEQASQELSTPTPTPTLYPEPSVKPDCLPTEAKWNPYKGAWYDSSEVEIDPVTHRYKNVPFTTPPGYIPPRVATMTGEEWIAQHQDSTNAVDIALPKYWQALAEGWEKQKQEDPYWMIRSWVYIGSEEGGPLTILTDLGISNLQKLLDYVQWENPFVYYLVVATDRICRLTITSGGDSETDYQVNKWRKGFNEQATGAASTVDGIAQELANGQADEKAIEVKFARMGILALPEIYELVINQGNTDLIRYLPDLLPLDKIKTYNIQTGATDEATLKQALASCTEDIEIIKTLHTD